MLRIDLVSPHDTTLDLFLETREPGSWGTTTRSLQTELRAGENERYLHLPDLSITGPMVLRPGRKPGAYVLRGLEIRATP